MPITPPALARQKPSSLAVNIVLSCLLLVGTSCAAQRRGQPPLTQNQELEGLMRLAAYPNSETLTLLVTMQQFTAAHREWEGYDYFGRMAREQASRRVLLNSLQAVMEARVANDVPLWRRIAWVEDAIAKLDAGAAADPALGRFARGLVFAELPKRFGKSGQAVEDLEFCLAHRDAFPIELDRGILRGLALAYQTLGNVTRSRELLARAGFDAQGIHPPPILTDLSVNAVHGFRFGEKRLVQVAEGVYVAEGYDFANISFIVTKAFVVAIDAGTTEGTAREALLALRKVTNAPIKYLILTHGHWDHVGGIAAIREAGTTIIAQSRFPEELARSRAYHPPFQYFFGQDVVTPEVRPDRLVSSRETLVDGDLELDLIAAPSGETDDALFVHDKRHDVLFVGDAFMPYLGAPFVAEGSSQGFLDAAATVIRLKPRLLLHGHPPLTALFTLEAMPGLSAAMTALRERTVAAAQVARPLADVLHENFVPDSLRSTPRAALPYIVARDGFIQRTYLASAGYWQSDGEGLDHFTREEWGSALDALGGGGDGPFVRVADDLAKRGDAPLALRVAEIGLARHPDSSALRRSRQRVLEDLRQRYSQNNPFRFILVSEWAQSALSPVTP
jgi:glyoxylase-like metal-dependent hydrolase (beta-lactamase superfamily II)